MMTKSKRSAAPTPCPSIMKPLYVSAFGLLKGTHTAAIASLLIGHRCGIENDLGVKGTQGVLKSNKTRRAFLEDPSHRIRFVYTPRHCSWLNQVEIWLSILARRLLKRSSFSSLHDLRERVLAFIEYFNKVLAKPF